MKIWLPKCGDAVRLTKDWSFQLHEEYRNSEVWRLQSGSAMGCQYRPVLNKISCMMPCGTELVFDRLYVRQDNDAYASVTFVIKEHQDDRYIGERFG